jgi:hypothetical protein
VAGWSFGETFWSSASNSNEPIPITQLSPSERQRSTLSGSPASPERSVTKRTAPSRKSFTSGALSTPQESLQGARPLQSRTQRLKPQAEPSVTRTGPVPRTSQSRPSDPSSSPPAATPPAARARTRPTPPPSADRNVPPPQVTEGAKRSGQPPDQAPRPPVRGSRSRGTR